MSSLRDLQQRAKEIAVRYAQLNVQEGHAPWGPKERMMGFITDVGELNELVMAKEGLRHMERIDTKLAHELSDCLWSVLVLADHYGVDLEKAFADTMNELERRTAV
jgi:NTP pyrophosphatase (non-canonical NTP hydrolase)